MKPPTPRREHVLLSAARIENAGAFGRSYSLAYKVKCLQLEASSWKNNCFFSEQITRMPSFLRVLVSAHGNSTERSESLSGSQACFSSVLSQHPDEELPVLRAVALGIRQPGAESWGLMLPSSVPASPSVKGPSSLRCLGRGEDHRRWAQAQPWVRTRAASFDA